MRTGEMSALQRDYATDKKTRNVEVYESYKNAADHSGEKGD